MTERGHTTEGAPACPFVAFEDDRDGRSTAPDHRHRCFAEPRPAPRAVAHQEAYCLSSAFPVCPTFQDWARREAAAARPAAATAPAVREEPPQSRPMPPVDREPHRIPGTETPPPVPARRSQQRDWAAPPPWVEGEQARDDDEIAGAAVAGAAAGALWGPGIDDDPDPDVPAVPARDAGRAAPSSSSRQPAEWSSESRGLAGSAAHRLAGPDPDEPRPAVPESRDRAAQDDRYPDDDLDDAWAEGTGAGAYVAGSATARTPGSRSADDERYAPPSRKPASSSRRPARPEPRPEPRPSSRDQVHKAPQQDPQELFGPAWERPRRYEAYPSLRTRIGLPSTRGVPRVALYGGGLLIAALVLFLFGPRLLGLVGEDEGTGAASPTPAATVEITPEPEPTEPPEPTPQVYIVKSGDTMSKIAKKFNTTVEDIMAANPQIKNPDKIKIGDQITIPVATPDENGFPEDDGTVEGETPAP